MRTGAAKDIIGLVIFTLSGPVFICKTNKRIVMIHREVNDNPHKFLK